MIFPAPRLPLAAVSDPGWLKNLSLSLFRTLGLDELVKMSSVAQKLKEPEVPQVPRRNGPRSTARPPCSTKRMVNRSGRQPVLCACCLNLMMMEDLALDDASLDFTIRVLPPHMSSFLTARNLRLNVLSRRIFAYQVFGDRSPLIRYDI